MRSILSNDKISPAAHSAIESFHKDVVDEVKTAIGQHKIVVVGMSQNPVVKKARRILDEEGLQYHYLEYGSYMAMWKQRLAIKLWSGWPTFPQVFFDGVLIGGAADLKVYLSSRK